MALNHWNKTRNKTGQWISPRKGTPEYDEVRELAKEMMIKWDAMEHRPRGNAEAQPPPPYVPKETWNLAPPEKPKNSWITPDNLFKAAMFAKTAYDYYQSDPADTKSKKRKTNKLIRY